MAISGERFGEVPPLHNHERKAIRQAPALIGARPIQSDSRVDQFRLKRRYLDVHIRLCSPIALYRYAPSAWVRKSVQPLPKDSLGGQNLAARPDHELVPFNSAGMMLVSSAR